MIRSLLGGVCLAALITLVGCARHRVAPEAMAPAVSVAQVIEAPVTEYEDFTGRTDAVESVTLKARATGYLDKVLFKDGELVQKDQPLYQIDARTYEAQLKNAEAAIARTQATLERANSELARARQMSIGSAMSREEYDKKVATKSEAQATLADNKATLETAKLNLGFTKVMAPITGVVSRTQITPGNLVSQDMTTLTTIVSIDPIYAYFDVDERTVLRIQEMIREEISTEGVQKADAYLEKHKVGVEVRKQVAEVLKGRVAGPQKREIGDLLKGSEVDPDWFVNRVLGKYPKFKSYKDTKVPLYLATQIEKGFPHEGHIDFVDNQLNASTGTLRVRGNFANPDQVLRPNLFVRIRLPIGEPHPSLLVSDAAIVTEQDRKFLYVLGKDDEVEARPVRLGPQRGAMRVIESGVEKGDWVIVSGTQRAAPGAKVKPNKVAMPDYAPAGGAGAPPVVKEKK